MQLLEHTQECQSKYDLWPYKRSNTGGSITKNYRCVDLTMMHICTKFERNPSRNVACRAHRTIPPKYDLLPYKRRNIEGSITKTYRCVDIWLWCTSVKILKEMWPAEHTQDFHQNMTFDPLKDFTMIHLHTKFERNPSRNAAVGVHTRIWTKIWPLTL